MYAFYFLVHTGYTLLIVTQPFIKGALKHELLLKKSIIIAVVTFLSLM